MSTTLSLKTVLMGFVFSLFAIQSLHAAAIAPATTKKEQRTQLKTLKKDLRHQIKELKAQHGDMDNNQVLAIIFSVILPPLGVLIHQGTINNKFWLSLLLTLIIWLPGVIYSLLVVTGNA